MSDYTFTTVVFGPCARCGGPIQGNAIHTLRSKTVGGVT